MSEKLENKNLYCCCEVFFIAHFTREICRTILRLTFPTFSARVEICDINI